MGVRTPVRAAAGTALADGSAAPGLERRELWSDSPPLAMKTAGAGRAALRRCDTRHGAGASPRVPPGPRRPRSEAGRRRASAGRRRGRSSAGARADAPSPRHRTRVRPPAAGTRSASRARRSGTHQVDRQQGQREPERRLERQHRATQARSDNSAIDAENCAESATMLIPQTTQSAASQAGSPPNSRPTVAAQLPLRVIAAMVSVVRPSRSRARRLRRADRPCGDRRERCELGRRRRDTGRQRQREARVEEDADPRPHRVQLPHVTEISEVREPQRDVAPRRGHDARIEARRRCAIRRRRRQR